MTNEKQGVINALKGLQTIGIILIISTIPVIIYPILSYGLIISCILLILYVRDLEKKIKRKENEKEVHQIL